MTVELEHTLQKRLDESNTKKEAQFVSNRLHCNCLCVVGADHFVNFGRKSNADMHGLSCMYVMAKMN